MASSQPHRSQSGLVNHHLHRHRRAEVTEETALVEQYFIDELRGAGASGQRLEFRVARLKGIFNRFASMRTLEEVPDMDFYPVGTPEGPSLDALRQWRSDEHAKTNAREESDETHAAREMIEIIYTMLLSEYVDWCRVTGSRSMEMSSEVRHELRKGYTFKTIQRELGVALLPMLANTPGPLSSLASVTGTLVEQA